MKYLAPFLRGYLFARAGSRLHLFAVSAFLLSIFAIASYYIKSPPPVAAATSVFINEIHYDNASTDTGEAIEVAGPAGTDLAGWSIVLYNGSGGAVYDTFTLSGVIPNQQNNFGTLSFPRAGIQNGSPDGIALVNGATVVQFLSYEGTFTAVGGPADGMVSIDIGVIEGGADPVGQSLQLSGTGCMYEDFTWNAAAANTFGTVNTAQISTCGGGDAGPSVTTTIPANAASNVATDANISITFSEDVNVAGNWFQISCSVSGLRQLSDTVVSGGPGTFTINPNTDFTPGELCTVTVFAAQVTDQDANDPPDNMASDATFSFTIASPPVASNVIINEVDSDTPGTDAAEFIELYDGGAGNTSLTGMVVVLYNGSTDVSYAAFDLDGKSTDPNGYFVLGNSGVPGVDFTFANGLLQNGADAVALYLADATSFPTNTPITTANLIDAVVYDTADADDPGLLVLLNAGQPQVNEDGGGDGTNDSIQRCPNGSGGARNTASFIARTPTPDAANNCPPPPVAAAIHDIQGSGNASPFADQAVTTTGIVTGRRSNGFYLQEPDAGVDANPATSEGIFVFTSVAPPADAAVGNAVQVTGTVQEFIPSQDPLSPPTTELSGSPAVTLMSMANPLPAPITLTSADTGTGGVNSGSIENLERYEGMRVRAASLTAVAPTQGSINETNATSTSNGVFYGVITGVPRPFREPGIQANDPVPAGSGVTIPPVPRFDFNPERVRVDSDALTGAVALNVTSGATVSDVVGPLDYAFRTYTILADPPSVTPTPVVSGNISAIPVPIPGGDDFTIASFNMERFFDTINDPAVDDAVLTALAFDNRLNKASLAIRNVMRTPDIIGVVEVENLSTLQAVASKINGDAVAAGQPDPIYQAFLEEGNDIGGIDVGFLVKTSIVFGSTPRVTVNEVVQEGKTATFIDPNNGLPALLNDRPSLRLMAVINHPDGRTFPITVIVNHLRSLNGVDDPADGNRVRTKRRAQAEFLANLIQARQTADPTERIISVGDYNAFQVNDGYGDSIGTIKGTPAPANEVVLASSDLVNPDLTELLNLVPADQRYSFSFDGNAQVLDHELITANLAPAFNHLNYARNDSDFPEVFRNDPNRPERISDHDMPVAYFTFGCGVSCPANITQSNDAGQCGAVVSYSAPTTSASCASVVCSPPSDSFFPVGATKVTCSEQIVNGASCSFTVTVNDTEAPVITGASANPSVLGPPNHRLVPVTISYTSSDNCGAVTCTLSVTSNEPVNGTDDGDTSPDWIVVNDHYVMLRAERSGSGTGRIYTITITCTDDAGNSSTQTVTVTVPLSQSS